MIRHPDEDLQVQNPITALDLHESSHSPAAHFYLFSTSVYIIHPLPLSNYSSGITLHN